MKKRVEKRILELEDAISDAEEEMRLTGSVSPKLRARIERLKETLKINLEILEILK